MYNGWTLSVNTTWKNNFYGFAVWTSRVFVRTLGFCTNFWRRF
jgi:hypothetical protein